MTDRQFVIEPLNGQSVNIRSGGQIVGRLTFVSSRVTGSTAGAAASLVTWAGNGQSAVAGATVTPPAVRVLDANGLPVAGSTVTWEGNTISGATQQGLTGTSDSNGVVTLGGWSVGTTAGSASTVFAYSGNLTNSPIRFSITPTAASAFSVAVSAGNSQASTPVSLLASRLTALVQDRYGNNVNGASVDWTSSSGDAAFGTTPGTTNSSGLVGTTYTTGQSASTESAWAAISSATSARFGVGVYAAPPTTVDIVSGDNQTALSGATLAQPLVVFVGDGFNNPWSSGQTVQFVVVGGSGNVSSATSTPDANGLVSVTWKMGATAGANRLEVSLANISGSTVTFTASGTNPVADTIQIESGNSQTGTAGSALALPLAVATLGSGSSASGQLVTFSATSGSLSTSAIVSSTSGIARTVWTLPTGAGTYTVTASAGTLAGSPLVFSATANAGTATQLVLATQPSSQPEIGVAWPQQPVVVSADQYGNPASTNTRVQCVLLSGDGTLDSGVSTFATASGETATFSGLSYTYASVNSFQVGFRCNSLSTVTASVQTSQAPFASKLAFTTQPTGGAAGSGIGTVVVAVEDAGGAVVGSATNAVTVALTSSANTEGGTLSGTLTQNAAGGYATFTNLSVDTVGSFTLDATATGLTGTTSAAFSLSSTNYGNEPAGYVRLFGTNGLDLASGNTRFTRSGNYAYADSTVTRTTSPGGASIYLGPGPISSPNVLLLTVPTTIVAGNGTGQAYNTDLTGKNARRAYYAFWFKASSNWYGQSQGIIKMFMPRVTLTGVQNRIVVAPYGAGNNSLSLRVAFQSCATIDGANGLSTTYKAPAAGTGAINRNQWHKVEILLVGNTAGQYDGSFQMWMDGLSTHSYQAAYDASKAVKWGQFDFNSTWGGTSGGGPPDSQYLAFDHVFSSYTV